MPGTLSNGPISEPMVIPLVVFGAFFLIALAIAIVTRKMYKSKFKICTTRVAGRIQRKRQGIVGYPAQIFYVVNGQQYVYTIIGRNGSHLYDGDTLELLCNPENPYTFLYFDKIRNPTYLVSLIMYVMASGLALSVLMILFVLLLTP